jgi:hypothetical protein
MPRLDRRKERRCHGVASDEHRGVMGLTRPEHVLRRLPDAEGVWVRAAGRLDRQEWDLGLRHPRNQGSVGLRRPVGWQWGDALRPTDWSPV